MLHALMPATHEQTPMLTVPAERLGWQHAKSLRVLKHKVLTAPMHVTALEEDRHEAICTVPAAVKAYVSQEAAAQLSMAGQLQGQHC